MKVFSNRHPFSGGRCLFYVALIVFSFASFSVSAQDQNAGAAAPAAQAPQFSVPDSFAPGAPILFFRDEALGDDVFDDALDNLGFGGDVTFTSNRFEFADLLDDQDWGCVIALNQNEPNTGAFAGALTAYVNGGGRAIFTDWYINSSGEAALYDAFGVAGTGSINQSPITTDGNAIWDGVPAAVGLFNPGWGIYSMGLAAVGSGVGTGTFPNGDSAVVIGNGGATAFNGFLSDTFSVTAEGIQIAENQINEICFPDVFENTISPFTTAPLIRRLSGFTTRSRPSGISRTSITTTRACRWAAVKKRPSTAPTAWWMSGAAANRARIATATPNSGGCRSGRRLAMCAFRRSRTPARAISSSWVRSRHLTALAKARPLSIATAIRRLPPTTVLHHPFPIHPSFSWSIPMTAPVPLCSWFTIRSTTAPEAPRT
jgi:hypothetical protein